MPGFEVIGKEEKNSINKIFSRGNEIMFRHGFEKLKKNLILNIHLQLLLEQQLLGLRSLL